MKTYSAFLYKKGLLAGLFLIGLFFLSISSSSAQNILFVVGDSTLDAGDNIIALSLENEPSVQLQVIDDDVVTSSDANGKDLVLISSSTTASKIGTTFTNTPTIVSTMNYELLDELGMTDPGGAGSFFGNSIKLSDPATPWWLKLFPIQVTNNNHPLSYASTNGNATIHSHVPGDPSQALSFTYPSGVQLCNGQTAPADRVGLFLQDAYPTLTDLTASGQTLLQASFGLTQPIQTTLIRTWSKFYAPADTGLLRSGHGVQLSDGTYMILGAGMSTDTIDNNFLVMELDELGFQTGAYHYQTSNLKEAVNTGFTVQTLDFASDGDILFTTQGRNVIDGGFAPNVRPALIRLDQNRNIEFLKSINTAYPRTPTILKGTPDNGAILVSFTSNSILTQKFDAQGDTVWNKNIQQDKIPADLHIFSDGSMVMLLNEAGKSYLMFLDSQGTWSSETELSPAGLDDIELFTLKALADSNLLVTGRAKVSGENRLPLLLVSPQGQILDKKILKADTYGDIRGIALAAHPNGGFAIAGGIVDPNQGDLERPFLARFQNDLDPLGIEVYEAYDHQSSKNIAATNIQLTDDWGYLISASQYDRVYYKAPFADLIHTGDAFPMLIKTDAEGILRTPNDCKVVSLSPAGDILEQDLSSAPSSPGDISAVPVTYSQNPSINGASGIDEDLAYTEIALTSQTILPIACPVELPPCPTVGITFLSPSSDKNYVTTYAPRVAVDAQNGSSGLSELQSLDYADELIQQVSYFDGLGRPIQQIALQASANAADAVSFTEYDNLGRETKAYMAYEAIGTYGAFQTNPSADQEAFYLANFSTYVTDLNNPRLFAETQFEASPLNRALEAAAPGDPWKTLSPNGGQREAGEHTIISEYSVNTSAIVGWGLDPSIPASRNNSYYPVGSLTKTITTDENDGEVITFTDKLGRIVLTEIDIEAGETATTYYIYDKFGRVKYILQPEGFKEATINSNLTQTTLDKFAFQYEYDSRGRISRKRVPGGGWIEYVYNQLDQLVLSQDANQADSTKWSYTKYDGQGRPIETGLYTSSSSKAALEGIIYSYPQFEVRQNNADGYSNTSFPTSNTEKLSVTYYDDYDFDFDGTPDYFYSSISPNENARNFVTGVKTRVLGSLNFLLTLTFYDTYGREVETRAEHLHGIDLTKYSVNFIGEIEGNNTLHNGPSATTIDQTREYCYDHNGRPLRITSQVNTDQRIVLAAYEYDVLGRQKTKKLHSKDGTSFIQGIDYSYNVRDWITGINPIKASTDLFSMKLFYNEGLLTGHHNAAPSFNGNITGMIWETELDTEEHGYSFAYDQMNRLKSSVYASGYAMTNNTGRYDVSLSYDKNGNIKTLDRYGKATSGYGLMDDLDYTYDGNRLDRVEETSPSSAPVEQFIDGTHSGTDYLYDFNGNVKEDKNKGIIINYNHLNKPTLINKGSNTITYIYDAAGTKLQQIVSDGSTKTNDYINGVHYSDNVIQFIQHEEGRLVPDGTIAEYRYEYHLTDHLGNARVTFSDMNDDGVLNMTTDVLQTDHYYPFGMRMSLDAAVSSTATPENQYLYNGKELQTDLDLDWYDYGARMYDASIARWNGVDPLAENHFQFSTFIYTANNPIRYIDPDGQDFIVNFLSQDEKQRNADKIKFEQYLNNGLGGKYTASIADDGRVSISENKKFDGKWSKNSELFYNILSDAMDPNKEDVTVNVVHDLIAIVDNYHHSMIDIDQVKLFEDKKFTSSEGVLLHFIGEQTDKQRRGSERYLIDHGRARDVENQYEGYYRFDDEKNENVDGNYIKYKVDSNHGEEMRLFNANIDWSVFNASNKALKLGTQRWVIKDRRIIDIKERVFTSPQKTNND